MISKYLFETNHFGITDSEVHLLRGQFPYKKIHLDQFRLIEIKKGINTKHPFRLLGFGASLIGVSIFLISHYQWPGFSDMFSRGFAAIVVVHFCLLIVGFWSAKQASSKTEIIKLSFDAGYEIFPIKSIIKENRLEDLKLFLKENIPDKKLQILI